MRDAAAEECWQRFPPLHSSRAGVRVAGKGCGAGRVWTLRHCSVTKSLMPFNLILTVI